MRNIYLLLKESLYSLFFKTERRSASELGYHQERMAMLSQVSEKLLPLNSYKTVLHGIRTLAYLVQYCLH